MNINQDVLRKIEQSGSQFIAVTKYLDEVEIQQVLGRLRESPAFWGVGENRVEQLRTKNLFKNEVHFIGNLQSRKIPEIVERCSVIHSLCEFKHAKILSEQNAPVGVFLQVNISQEKQKSGIMPEGFSDFLEKVSSLEGLEILGISALGFGECSESEKRKEFQELKSLRDQFLPDKKISAGTSRDYEIALDEGIEIVRVGKSLFSERFKT